MKCSEPYQYCAKSRETYSACFALRAPSVEELPNYIIRIRKILYFRIVRIAISNRRPGRALFLLENTNITQKQEQSTRIKDSPDSSSSMNGIQFDGIGEKGFIVVVVSIDQFESARW